MIIISHRGNLTGPNSAHFNENHPSSIAAALQAGFDVEIDVWLMDDNKFYLGHDKALYPIHKDFFNNDKLWIHAKNGSAMHALNTLALPNVFFHNEDDIAFTSKGFLWSYPRKEVVLFSTSIAVMPERVPEWDLSNIAGVCTDFPYNYVGK